MVDGGGRDAYEAGHIPGAIHTDYVKDGWRATKGMAAGLLPDRAALGDLLGGLGLAPHRHAVIVSAGTTVGDFSAAARVYWTLKAVGHEKTSILAGGMVGWRRDPQRPLEVGAGAARVPASAYPIRLAAGLRAELDAVKAAVADESAVLLDSRATSFFEGRAKSPQVARPGRLPGALQLDHAWCSMRADGAQTEGRARQTVCRDPAEACDQLLQHRASSRDQLVRPLRGARPPSGLAL